MAHLPFRRHGCFPRGQATPSPWVTRYRVQLTLEAAPPETASDPAAPAEEPSLSPEHLFSTGFSEMEKESCNTRVASPSADKQRRQPAQDVTTLLRRIRTHPQAQRILGNSIIPVVSLERLNFRSVFLSSSLRPVVSLVRLRCQTEANLCGGAASRLDSPQQDGCSQNEANVAEIIKESCKPAGSSDVSPLGSVSTSWTEPCRPASASSEGPEQDSGFDWESNPDQPYILLDSGSDEWDPDEKPQSETFYLDPGPEQTVVIELDPEVEADQDQCLELEDGSEVHMVETDSGEDQRLDLCCSQEEVSSSIRKPETGPETEEVESEDFCAVCLNGGDLLCCDRCPKVYHLSCHIPPLTSFPIGDWVCTPCRTDREPVDSYDCENMQSCGRVRTTYVLSNQDQRRCEKLTLLLYCHTLSAPFHEPVSPLARNYYQVIKRPISLSVIRKKLDRSNTLHYFTAEQFVDDVLLMFRNCAAFNYPDSEVAQAGRKLEVFFLSHLKEIFPERTFPSANQDTMDRARLRWLGRKRREHCRKRHVFNGKKYYL